MRRLLAPLLAGLLLGAAVTQSPPVQQEMNDATLPALASGLAVLDQYDHEGCVWVAWTADPDLSQENDDWANDVVECSPGSPPIASVPLDPAPWTDTPPDPTFLFRFRPMATRYLVWVSYSPSGAYIASQWFDTLAANCSAGVICAVQIAGLYLAPGDYRWWVRTWNPNGYGEWSVKMDFEVE